MKSILQLKLWSAAYIWIFKIYFCSFILNHSGNVLISAVWRKKFAHFLMFALKVSSTLSVVGILNVKYSIIYITSNAWVKLQNLGLAWTEISQAEVLHRLGGCIFSNLKQDVWTNWKVSYLKWIPLEWLFNRGGD